MMNPIAKPIGEIGASCTVVVVGSGYGAGVAASRLARAGQSVCVLERGREILPGEFPDDLAKAGAQVQVDTARGRIGNEQGLYNLHVNDDVLALVGCGLGGTSLINANVALEMDPRLFATQSWPDEFRNDPHVLDVFRQRALEVLDPSPYPQDAPPLAKLAALEMSARALNRPFSRPPIAVNFIDQTNPFGVVQPKCTLCGDCTSGCNVGAKNTTRMNYLPDAHRHGAQLFTGARVTHVSREGERWRVHFDAAPFSVVAEVVVLGAGTLGSTEILLRSRERGLPLSDRLGERFSGNGDVLAVGYDSHWNDVAGQQPDASAINGIGLGSREARPGAQPGPCIAGLIDMRQGSEPAEGLVIEEGVIPGAIAAMLPAALFFASAQDGGFFRFGAEQAAARLRDAGAVGQRLMQSPGDMPDMAYDGPTARTQTYLVMSVDESAGQLQLRDDRLRIHWPGAGDSPVIARDNEILKEASDAIRAQFIANPLWSEPLGRKLITVHPVGGCAMGNEAGDGVVDHKCRVFSGPAGREVHPGLYVCDGAVLPGAVGVNPLLTIASVAERACQLLADDRGWRIDLRMGARQPMVLHPPSGAVAAPRASRAAELSGLLVHAVLPEIAVLAGKLVAHLEEGALDLAKDVIAQIIAKDPRALSPSFEFRETMEGWVSLQAVLPRDAGPGRLESDARIAAAWGRAVGQSMRFDLRVHTEDLHRLVTDPRHPALLAGTVTCPALSSRPMTVASGEFHLLTVDDAHVETWRMSYDMVLQTSDEDTFHFSGVKVLHERDGSSCWGDLTTLQVAIREGSTPHGRLVARGVLTLGLEDLLWQSSTIRAIPNAGPLGALIARHPRAAEAVARAYLAKFAGFFAGVAFRAYGGMLSDLKDFHAQEQATRTHRPLRAPDPQAFFVDLPDGFRVKLTRYRGGDRGPVILAPGFSVHASSFAIDTVDENLVEHLCARSYDVWLFDYRASSDSGSPQTPFTIDDIATVDWPAAVRFILDKTARTSVQAIAHCVGSMSLLMALLKGLDGVRSVVSSQLTLHPVTDWLSDMKADVDMVRLLESASQLKGVFDNVPGNSDFDHEVDTLAWNVPLPPGEACKNPVCRRVFAIFGPSYAHGRLNHWTHVAMREMFGRVSLKPFEQLTRIMQRGQVLDALGNDSYLQQPAARLALPIGFIAGEMNQLFFPETSARTFVWLRARNDPALYTRRQFPGYAHMDLFVGRDAARDIFPAIVQELERADAMLDATAGTPATR